MRKPLSQPVLIGVTSAGDSVNMSVEGAFHPRRGWMSASRAHTLFRPGKQFTAYDVRGRSVGTFRLREVFDAEEFGYRAMGAGKLPKEGEFLALAGAPKSTTRPVTTGSLSDSAAQKMVADALRAKGLSIARPRLTQNLRVDLNGDGTSETFIAASAVRPGSGEQSSNYYSIVLLRFASGGTTRTLPLETTVLRKAYPDEVVQHQVLACKDIDGDGRAEIVLYHSYYEGSAISVIRFDGKRAQRVLGAP